MTSSALLTVVAIVASIDGGQASLEGERLEYLRPGDTGLVHYEITVGSEVRTIEVGTANVVGVSEIGATVRIVSERQVLPGFGVRFELPVERLRVEGGEARGKLEGVTQAQYSEGLDVLEAHAQLEARILAWAAAWSSQDVEAYLGFYARDYRPANGIDRVEWEIQRHQRLTVPEYLNVAIEDFEVVSSTPGRAQVRFDQNYRSDTFEDWVTKTLSLVVEDGAWKIGAEESSTVRRREAARVR